MEPKVSIIIPVYNVEKYIERCLESISKQKYKDFEVIIINDGSIDNTDIICHRYETMYPDKITYRYQENKDCRHQLYENESDDF